MTASRRVTLAALSAAASLALLGDMLLYTVLPSNPAVAGISAGALGVILSVHRFIRLIANSVGGVLYDRFGRRRPFLLGMMLAVVATSGYLVAHDFWLLLIARLCWGLAFALISVGALSILLDVTTPEDRGATIGAYQSLLSLGTLLTLLASGVLADLVGYRGTLMIFVPLTALGWIVAFAALRETHPGYAPGLARGVLGDGLRALLTARRAADRRLLVPGYAGFVGHFAVNGVLMATLGAHLKQELASGSSPLVPVVALTGILLASRKLAGIVCAPLAGHLSDRLGDRRRVACVGIATSLLGFTMLAAGHGLSMIVPGVALVSVGEGILLPALSAWVGDLTPAALRGVIAGGYATANDLGGATGPVVGYALAGALGLAWAYALSGVLLLSALAALVSLGPDPRRVRRSVEAL